MEFGEKLRILRERRGMTLNELAKLTGYATHSPLSLFENGKRKPTLDFVYKVAEVFGVSFDLLLNDNLELESEQG
jgi:transcriptional regulator with XRE-family HTH domain